MNDRRSLATNNDRDKGDTNISANDQHLLAASKRLSFLANGAMVLLLGISAVLMTESALLDGRSGASGPVVLAIGLLIGIGGTAANCICLHLLGTRGSQYRP